MRSPSRFLLAKDQILPQFTAAPGAVYSEADLAGILYRYKRAWNLPDSTTAAKFAALLAKHGELRTHIFIAAKYEREIVRYSWSTPSNYTLALSLKPRGYAVLQKTGTQQTQGIRRLRTLYPTFPRRLVDPIRTRKVGQI